MSSRRIVWLAWDQSAKSSVANPVVVMIASAWKPARRNVSSDSASVAIHSHNGTSSLLRVQARSRVAATTITR